MKLNAGDGYKRTYEGWEAILWLRREGQNKYNAHEICRLNVSCRDMWNTFIGPECSSLKCFLLWASSPLCKFFKWQKRIPYGLHLIGSAVSELTMMHCQNGTHRKSSLSQVYQCLRAFSPGSPAFPQSPFLSLSIWTGAIILSFKRSTGEYYSYTFLWQQHYFLKTVIVLFFFLHFATLSYFPFSPSLHLYHFQSIVFYTSI